MIWNAQSGFARQSRNAMGHDFDAPTQLIFSRNYLEIARQSWNAMSCNTQGNFAFLSSFFKSRVIFHQAFFFKLAFLKWHQLAWLCSNHHRSIWLVLEYSLIVLQFLDHLNVKNVFDSCESWIDYVIHTNFLRKSDFTGVRFQCFFFLH